MSTPLIPQEIYLLERYSSLEYYMVMKDAWAKMVNAAERALDQFVNRLPADYRSRHLSQQPDIVWGERVLPNFRSTMAYLDESNIKLKSGDLQGLSIAGGVLNDIVGQGRDYLPDWMPKELEEEFYEWQGIASHHASNIAFTAQSGWLRSSLSRSPLSDGRGALNPPDSWPLYQLEPKVIVKTGDQLIITGIYLPDCDDSCAQLLIKQTPDPDFSPEINLQLNQVPEANIGYDTQRMQRVGTAATTWTLVKRIADTGGGIPGNTDPLRAGVRIRVMGNQPCPNAGYYFTPAQSNSRRHFKQGDTMPSLGGDYGVTIWQWDADQNPPRS
jgi:hypothetical protein